MTTKYSSLLGLYRHQKYFNRRPWLKLLLLLLLDPRLMLEYKIRSMQKNNVITKFKTGLLMSLLFIVVGFGANVNALDISYPSDSIVAVSMCGSGKDAIITSIDFGCNGANCLNTKTNKAVTKTSKDPYCNGNHNAFVDLLFAIIRFISDGVGLILIASIIIAGIQYTFSRGEPQEVKLATKRVQSAFSALLIFILAYAILNFIIPNGFFGQ